MQAFKDSPNTDLVLGNVDFVDAKDLTRPVHFYSSFQFLPWKMRFGFMPAHPGAFIKKRLTIKSVFINWAIRLVSPWDPEVLAKKCFTLSRAQGKSMKNGVNSIS